MQTSCHLGTKRGGKQKSPVLTHTDHGKHQKANGAHSLKNVPRLCISVIVHLPMTSPEAATKTLTVKNTYSVLPLRNAIGVFFIKLALVCYLVNASIAICSTKHWFISFFVLFCRNVILIIFKLRYSEYRILIVAVLDF